MRATQPSGSSTPNFTPEFQQILESIQNNTATKINLAAEDLGNNGIKELAKALIANRSLEVLNFWGTPIGDEGAKIISEMLKNNDKLKIINFYNNNIGDDGAKDIAEALGVNTTLTKLYLSNNNIGNVGAQAFAEALRVNTTLTKLELSEKEIGDVGVTALARALTKNNTLTDLDLFRNIIGPNGAIALAEALKVNVTLTKLNLFENEIGDVGAQALANALGVNTTLKELDLSKNNIGDDGATALAGALSENFTLLELRMSPSINVDLKTQIENYLARNNEINEIATKIFDYYYPKGDSTTYTQDPTTPPFPRIDDELIKEPQICLKIFEKSLSKIIDFKKTNGQEVNEGQIREEFIEHLKSSRGGMRLLLSCTGQSNLFGLNLRDYFWYLGVTKSKDDKIEIENGEFAEDDKREKEKKEISKNIVTVRDIFPTILKYLPPPLVKDSAKAPSTNPSSPRANPMGFNLLSLIDERGWGCKIS